MRRLLAVLIAPFVISACGGTPTTPTPQQQAAVPCVNIVLSSGTITQSAGGGATSITVTPNPANCTWTSVSNNAFLRITSAATVTGPGSFTFTTDPNTGAGQRNGNITVGNAFVVVNQLGTAPPITWAPAAPPNGVVGVAYRHDFGGANGGVAPLSYSLDSGGFPPNGLILSPDGILSGVPTAATPQTGGTRFRVCVRDATGTTQCTGDLTIIIAAAPVGPAPGDASALIGNWGGTITLTRGCYEPLPATFSWTGSFRRNARNEVEFVVSVPSVLFFDEIGTVTLNGRNLEIRVDFDSIYTFRGTLSDNTNFIQPGATFEGANCHLPSTPVLPAGTWTGQRR